MATQLTIAQILNVARVAQYLAGNKAERDRLLKGSFLDQGFDELIHLERRPLQYLYTLNPNESDQGMRNAANYLFDLLGPFGTAAQQILGNTGQAPPTITNPASVALGVGQSAVFTVSVTSALPYTLQWFIGTIPIAGATGLSYTFPNAQLTDSGDMFHAVATNAVGQAVSLNATLTVSASAFADFWYGDVDNFQQLSTQFDNLVYQLSFPISHNQPVVVNVPLAAANNKYQVLRLPIAESAKTTWYSTPVNNGTIPDSVFRAIFTNGAFQYIISRVAMSVDANNLIETFS